MVIATSKSTYKVKIWIRVLMKLKNHMQIMIKIPSMSSKASDQDKKNMDALCTLEYYIFNQEYIKANNYIQIMTKILVPNQKHSASPNLITGLKGHGCFLHLKNQERKLKLRTCLYWRLMTISLSNPIQEPPVSSKAQVRTLMTWMFFASSKSFRLPKFR